MDYPSDSSIAEEAPWRFDLGLEAAEVCREELHGGAGCILNCWIG